MKKLFILFLLLISFVLFGQDLMHIKVGDIGMSIPEGWLIQYSNTQQIFYLYAPVTENDGFHENGNVTYEELPRKYTIKDYMEASVSQLEEIFNDFKVIKSEGNYHIISGEMQGIKVQQIQYSFMKGLRAYVLTFSSTPDKFNQYEQVFRDMAATFSVK